MFVPTLPEGYISKEWISGSWERLIWVIKVYISKGQMKGSQSQALFGKCSERSRSGDYWSLGVGYSRQLSSFDSPTLSETGPQRGAGSS